MTELEILAVVWACNHFHAYLYGHNVTVYTDHSAVKAILETSSPSGKHTRWSKVYGSGVKSVHIFYRAGRDNVNAAALSRNPQLPPPTEDMAAFALFSSAGNSSINEAHAGSICCSIASLLGTGCPGSIPRSVLTSRSCLW